MITIIAIIIICCFILLSFAFSLICGKYCVNYKRFRIEFLIVAIAAGVFGASLEPDVSLDLYRYHMLEESMISSHDISVWLYDSINHLFVWRLLLGTSVIFEDVHAISLFCVTLIFIFWYLILKEYKRGSKLNYREFLLYWFISISVVGINNIFLMIRNELAFAVQFYALIRLLNNKTKKNALLFTFLTIVAMFLHPAVIIIIFCYILTIVFRGRGKVFEILLLTWSFVISFIGNILLKVPFKYISNLGGAIKTYAQFSIRGIGDLSGFLSYLSEIGIVILTLLAVMYVRKINNIEGNKLYDFIFIYSLFSVGAIGFEAVLNRVAFGCGFLAIPIVKDLIKNKKPISLLILAAYIILAFGISAYGGTMITKHTEMIYWDSLFG